MDARDRHHGSGSGADQAVFLRAVGDRECSEVEAIRWVAKELNTPLGEIPPDSCPGRVAANLLFYMRSTPKATADFWSGIWTKVLPSKRELDQMEQMRDDGRHLYAIEAALIAAAAGDDAVGMYELAAAADFMPAPEEENDDAQPG